MFLIEQILICLFESLTSLNREQRAGGVMLCWTSSRPLCWKCFMTKSGWFDSQFPLCHTFHPLLSSWDNYRTLRDELNFKIGTFCQVGGNSKIQAFENFLWFNCSRQIIFFVLKMFELHKVLIGKSRWEAAAALLLLTIQSFWIFWQNPAQC